MKKFVMNIILILISLIIPSSVCALATSDAEEAIDLTKDCSLTLNYFYDDYEFDDVEVYIYHIASISTDFNYQLASNFALYPIKINGIKTDLEWKALEEVLNSYIEVFDIDADLSEKIIDNKIVLSNLEAGLYFIKTNKIDTEDYTLLFDSFLINVPELIEDGTWNYEVEVYPKAESYVPKYDDISYTVIKEWIDDGKNRPFSIEVEIYEDGNLLETVVLSKDNNFTYEWITKDDGSYFNVLEKNVPEGYEVSILKNDRRFIIVNTDPEYKEENPHTYDDIKLYFYLLIGSIIGIILLVIGLIIKKKNQG